MKDLIRLSPSISSEKIIVSRNFSNFKFIEERFKGNNLTPIRRILTLARQNSVQLLIVESGIEAKEIEEENEDINISLSKNKNSLSKSRIYRISFWKKEKFQECKDSDFIGYAIIKENHFKDGQILTNVYESVIYPGESTSSYIKGGKQYSVTITDKSFEIFGNVFYQQNNISNVCAHASIKMIVENMGSSSSVTYREINKILKINPAKRDLSKNGLTNREICSVFSNLNYHAQEINLSSETLSKHSNMLNIPSWEDFVYGTVESGFCSLLGFKSHSFDMEKVKKNKPDHHIITLIGHTFNKDTWVPRADKSYFQIGKSKYLSSNLWIDNYILHDDNLGPYYCIPKNFITTPRFCKTGNKILPCKNDRDFDIWIFNIYPLQCKIDSLRTQALCMHFIDWFLEQYKPSDNEWFNRMVKYKKESLLILRPILIKGDAYLNHLKKSSGWISKKNISEKEIEKLECFLSPDALFWMFEISIPELFSGNRRKIGEVLVNPNDNLTELEKLLRDEAKANQDKIHDLFIKYFVMARFPGYYYFPSESIPLQPSFYKDHIPLFGNE